MLNTECRFKSLLVILFLYETRVYTVEVHNSENFNKHDRIQKLYKLQSLLSIYRDCSDILEMLELLNNHQMILYF